NALLTIDPGPKNKFSVFYYKSQDQFSLNNTTDYRYSSQLSSMKWNYIPNDRLSMNTSLAYSNFENNIAESDWLRRSGAYQIYSDLDYYSLKWGISLSASEKHLLKFGFSGIFYDINPGELTPFGAESTVIPKNSRYESGIETAIYFSDDYSLSDRLKLKAGLRFSQFLPIEHIEKYKHETAIGLSGALGNDSVLSREYRTGQLFLGPEPRIALRYSLNNQSSLKFSYSRMYQYINLLSNTTVAAPSDLWKLSDAGLPPFVSDQVSLGYYLNLQGNTVELSAEGFFKGLRNIPEYKNGARLLLNDELENDLLDARGHAYGLELFAKKASGRLTGWVSYTWSRSLRRTSSGIEDEQINNNEYFPSYFDKPHNFATIANFHITRRWRISSTFSCSTGRPVTLPELKYEYNGYQLISYSDRNEYRLPDYHRLDLALTFDESLRIRKRWKGSWTLSLINVYGRKNVYSVFYQKDQASYDNTNKPFNLYKMYIIGQPLPTLTYNMSF
ncbi:MAG: TonB-dependent receptor, partial [Bacteroidales bacterium]|nr:TonB-dependent receptor [Bacteroidales bacterium]